MWDFSTLSFARMGSRSSPCTSTVTLSEEEPLQQYKRMRELKQSLPAAIAVSWDDSNVTILCPFCKKTHRHGISHFACDPKTGNRFQDDCGRYTYDGPSPTRSETRVAHCGHDGELANIDVSYTILFPFEKDSRVAGLSFEINKDLNEFRTVGLDVIPPTGVPDLESCRRSDAFEESELQRAIQDMSMRDGDYEVVTKIKVNGSEAEDQIDRASDLIESCAVNGDLDSLRRYLSCSPDPSSLIRIRSSNGESLLGLAVPNGHLEVVEFLLERGCDVNAADKKGRTPLMEAALWGRPQILDALLKAGANKLLQDRYGMTAHEFAEESDRNDLERHKRSFQYTENPHIKKGHRTFIRALLGHGQAPHNSAAKLSRDFDSRDAHFHKSRSAGTVSLVLPTQGIIISTQAKTAAVLLRGVAFPPVVAVSGWTGPHYEEFLLPEAGFERLNEGYWAFETLRVASDIGCSFEEHNRDKAGFPGIYNACHAEAQLMSLFVRRNFIFRDYEEDESGIEDDFLQLFMLQPKNCTPTILISNDPCASCRWFKKRIYERLGIRFSLQVLRVEM